VILRDSGVGSGTILAQGTIVRASGEAVRIGNQGYVTEGPTQ
jgi:hypothetical protein